MPDRPIYVGDTSPAIRLHLEDAEGLITTLPQAESIDVEFVGARRTFGGPGIPIEPPETDPKTGVVYNLRYPFATGDTDLDGAYKILVTITLQTGNPDQVETIDTPDRLLIEPRPTSQT